MSKEKFVSRRLNLTPEEQAIEERREAKGITRAAAKAEIEAEKRAAESPTEGISYATLCLDIQKEMESGK